MSGGDVELGKMFVGGLSWDTTKETLQTYFAKYGEVTDTTIMIDSVSGRPRGFGFVKFKNPDDTKLVYKQPMHTLDGKQIDPKPAMCKPSSQSTAVKKVFLGGLPAETTESDITKYFNENGIKVLEVDLKRDKDTRRMRGFGFLTLESSDAAAMICGQHYHTINGKQVEAKKADPKSASAEHPEAYQHAVYNPSEWTQQRSQYPGGGGYGNVGYSYNQQAGYHQAHGYGGQAGGYGGGSGYGGSGGYGGSSGYSASSYDSFPQPSGQQQANSYPDQTYNNTYSTSRNPDSYPTQQQQHYPQNYSQLYGSSTGTPGGRGQQTPQNSYTFAGGMP